MAKPLVSRLREALGLLDRRQPGTPGHAVFDHLPSDRLYHVEIPLLFACLQHDEGESLDQSDPSLFEVELNELLNKYGPLIWPSLDQGPRDHLLKPERGSHYPADLVYPRDLTMLKDHLRNMILNKTTRPGADLNALIERNRASIERRSGITEQLSLKTTTQPAAGAGSIRNGGHSPSPSGSPLLAEPTDVSSSDSEDSVIDHNTLQRARARGVSTHFKVALRLYRKSLPAEFLKAGPCQSYGTVFLTDALASSEECFAFIGQKINTGCTYAYMVFHPPEDMSLEGSIRIDRGSHAAETAYGRVMKILPGEPSYRTVEVEVGSDVPSKG